MSSFAVKPKTLYDIECWRKGELLWIEEFHNLVTVVGQNKLLDACFKSGESANAWFVGIVDNASFTAYSASDTMASHSGWLEAAGYSQATRPAYVAGVPALGVMDNSASRAVFTINTLATIRGAFLVDVSTKSGTLGVLYGVGDFTISRLVLTGDTINAKVTLSD